MKMLTVKQTAALALFLVLWELLPLTGVVNPIFIPRFSDVLATIGDLYETGELLKHAQISLVRAFTGLGAAIIIGFPLGLLLGGWFPRIQQASEPLMELFSQANPIILAHIVIFFLGIGETAKIFIIAWLSVWPITFSTISGIRSVDRSLLKAAESFGLGRWQLFIRVVLPSAAASIFTGLRLSAGYAFLMLIASEMMGAGSGLGWLVIQSQESYHVLRIFAGATVITFLAMATDLLIALLQHRIASWNVDYFRQERGMA